MRLEGILIRWRRVGFTGLATLGLSISPAGAFAACKIGRLAEIPVSMSGMQPLIAAKVNDQDVRFLIDSGASYSIMSAASAAQLKLKLTPAPFGLKVNGVNGAVDTSIATVKELNLAGYPAHNVEFIVGGSDVGRGGVGLLGQNIIRIGDVEYDLAKGVIRLFRVEGCSHALLAYWVNASQPYSQMDIASPTPAEPLTVGTAFVNGAKIRVIFDTGAGTSVLSLKAAARAGVRPDTAGVAEAGYGRGIGQGSIKTYTGPFTSFKIGDEEIRNTRLRFGDIKIENIDMLIGADFFLSHRIYVASSQHKLFFTYNGGPVFNLTASQSANGPSEPATDAAAAVSDADEPSDAAGFSRRGMAFAARRDFEHALGDLARAIEHAPDNAEYFYQRGIVHRENKQPVLALSDFDRSLELNPNDVSALAERASMRIASGDKAGAAADLDAADRLAAKEADVRFFLAQAYGRIDFLARSVAQYDLWILSHPEDARAGQALNYRCWERALQGEDLGKALTDCNRALRLADKSSPLAGYILGSRGLVRLRLGDYGKSIADYDAAVKLAPKNAWALYGRGVAEIRKKQVANGEADIAEAVKLQPNIGDEFSRHGVTP
jgi:tetratricopeptide (TPR) repeat protein